MSLLNKFPKWFRRIVKITAVITPILLALLSWDIVRFGRRDETRRADAAIVLGAAVFRERPSSVFRERINHAIQLYQDGYVDTIIFTGGLGTRDTQTEAEVGRLYAIEHGIPEADILIETSSTNTVENLTNAQKVAMEQNLDSFLIVSTPSHMRRALAIATDLDMEAYSSPTRTIRWISRLTYSRALIREVIAYLIYLAG